MEKDIQISFRGLPVSEAVETACLKEAQKLERYYDRITSCRIVVEEPHRRHLKGNLFHIRIVATVPKGEIVVNREPPQHREHEDVYVAVREAFDSARRQLEDHARKLRGDVKHHATPPGEA